MTPLRQRMTEDLKLRNRSPGTIASYVHRVSRLARFYQRSPDRISKEEVRAFLVDLVDRQKVSWSSYNIMVCALRFFFTVTLQRPDMIDSVPFAKSPKKLPVVLTQKDVQQFLGAIKELKQRAMFLLAYGAGLRVSEVVQLKVNDIDSQRMLIHVRGGKGQKDRLVMLSPKLLEVLREYWRADRPKDWLFPGREPDSHLGVRAMQGFCTLITWHAGLKKRVTVHSFRHAFATHLLEGGVDVRTIQALMGHRHLQTTGHYIAVSGARIQSICSPLDLLDGPPNCAVTAKVPAEIRSASEIPATLTAPKADT